MIARKTLPAHHVDWNRKWGAPNGSRTHRFLQMLGRPARPLNRLVDRFGQSLRGPFTIQENNTTRRAEYPWAYFATPLEPGLQVLELGGSLAGFQFVLDRGG